MLFAKTYKHSGDLGDIIYSLPVIKTYGSGKLLISDSIMPLKNSLKKHNIYINQNKTDNTFSGICDEKFEFIKPLLQKQPYITSVNRWHQNIHVSVDLDGFRLDKSSLFVYEKYINMFDVPLDKYETSWLDCDERKIEEIVISRTNRYKNYNFPWHSFTRKYRNKCVFVGLQDEYDTFIKLFGYIPYYKVQDAYDMACVIKGSKLFIGNQSLAYAIAEGLKHRSIQETYQKLPDCVFIRDNAKFFLGQKFVTLKYL